MTQAEVESKLRRAIRTLLREDGWLLKYDANERSITHKLAEYLQKEFRGWHVDCEYNLDGHADSKKLDLPPKCDISSADTEAHTVFPDIVVHRRGKHAKRLNLLVLEAKKSTNRVGNRWDFRKLRAFKSKCQLGYKYAAFVRFDTGRRWKQPPETVVNGDKIEWS